MPPRQKITRQTLQNNKEIIEKIYRNNITLREFMDYLSKGGLVHIAVDGNNVFLAACVNNRLDLVTAILNFLKKNNQTPIIEELVSFQVNNVHHTALVMSKIKVKKLFETLIEHGVNLIDIESETATSVEETVQELLKERDVFNYILDNLQSFNPQSHLIQILNKVKEGSVLEDAAQESFLRQLQQYLKPLNLPAEIRVTFDAILDNGSFYLRGIWNNFTDEYLKKILLTSQLQRTKTKSDEKNTHSQSVLQEDLIFKKLLDEHPVKPDHKPLKKMERKRASAVKPHLRSAESDTEDNISNSTLSVTSQESESVLSETDSSTSSSSSNTPKIAKNMLLENEALVSPVAISPSPRAKNFVESTGDQKREVEVTKSETKESSQAIIIANKINRIIMMPNKTWSVDHNNELIQQQLKQLDLSDQRNYKAFIKAYNAKGVGYYEPLTIDLSKINDLKSRMNQLYIGIVNSKQSREMNLARFNNTSNYLLKRHPLFCYCPPEKPTQEQLDTRKLQRLGLISIDAESEHVHYASPIMSS